MLLPAERRLVVADHALPGLETLLDGNLLSSWLAGAEPSVDRVQRTYVRYKPGTSCALGAQVRAGGVDQHVTVTAYSHAASAKFAKTVLKAPRAALLSVDRAHLVVATAPAADRDLPALAHLADDRRRRRLLSLLLPGVPVRSARLTTLSHKPQRRWVGMLTTDSGDHVLLRAYRPTELPGHVAVVRAFSVGRPRTPAVLGTAPDLGILAVEYLPGDSLDQRLGETRSGRTKLAGAGAALALLHDRPADSVPLPLRTVEDEARAVLAAAEHVATLLPDLAPAVRPLATEVAARLVGRAAQRTPVHGDFSVDQVVLGPSGQVALVDLDSGAIGDPASDLACAAAALAYSTVMGGSAAVEPRRLAALHDGYAAMRPLPDPEHLALQTSAELLRRAVDPFRLCSPRWPGQMQELVQRAASTLGAPAQASGS